MRCAAQFAEWSAVDVVNEVHIHVQPYILLAFLRMSIFDNMSSACSDIDKAASYSIGVDTAAVLVLET